MKNFAASTNSRGEGWTKPSKSHPVLINNFMGETTEVVSQRSLLKKKSDSVETNDTKLTSSSGQTLHTASVSSSSSSSTVSSSSNTRSSKPRLKTQVSRRNSISPDRSSTSSKAWGITVPNGVSKKPSDPTLNGGPPEVVRRNSSLNRILSRGKSWRRSSKSEDVGGKGRNSLGESSEEGESTSDVWGMFEDHLKSIPVAGDTFVRRPPPRFTSSDHFQKVMKDIYGRTDYNVPIGYSKFRAKVGNLTFLASQLTRLRQHHGVAEVAETAESDFEDMESDQEHEVSEVTRQNAERGWRLVRQHVSDMGRSKRNCKSKLQWDMIRQTLKQMSDLDSARLDLYKRYGVVPTLKDDGTVVQVNTMLSERGQQAELAAQRRSRIGLAASRQPTILRPSSESRVSPRAAPPPPIKARPRTARDRRHHGPS